MINYDKQANDFLRKTNTHFKAVFLGKKHCNWDNNLHNTYRVLLSRKGENYTFKFTDSLYNTEQNIRNIKAYAVLACLTKYEVANNLKDFANEFGYSIDTSTERQKTKNTWIAIQKEYSNVKRLFSDCMEELQEIC